MEFGDKECYVSLTALRLIQSFKRDWLTQGRRPAGLCGAAIRIAASFHGFRRSTRQIIGVVKVCEETIKRRIDEFKATPVAGLTQEAFEALDVGSGTYNGMNPPSFVKRKDIKLEELVSSEDIKLQLEHSASVMDIEIQREISGEVRNPEEELKEEEVIIPKELCEQEEIIPQQELDENKQLVPILENIIVPVINDTNKKEIGRAHV